MPAKQVKFEGRTYTVRLPKGQRAMSRAQESKILALESYLGERRKSLSAAKGCVIFFPRGAGMAVQRCDANRGVKTTAGGRCTRWAEGQFGVRCLKRTGVPKKRGGRPIPGRRSTRGGSYKKAGSLSRAAKRRWRSGSHPLK